MNFQCSVRAVSGDLPADESLYGTEIFHPVFSGDELLDLIDWFSESYDDHVVYHEQENAVVSQI